MHPLIIQRVHCIKIGVFSHMKTSQIRYSARFIYFTNFPIFDFDINFDINYVLTYFPASIRHYARLLNVRNVKQSYALLYHITIDTVFNECSPNRAAFSLIICISCFIQTSTQFYLYPDQRGVTMRIRRAQLTMTFKLLTLFLPMVSCAQEQSSQITPEESFESSATVSSHEIADRLTFSAESGFYEAPFSLTLAAPENAAVYYTLDGNIPTADSLCYHSAIEISDVYLHSMVRSFL